MRCVWSARAARASEKIFLNFKRARAPGSVRLVSVRLTEPCRQVRIKFGSVGKFRIWSEPKSPPQVELLKYLETLKPTSPALTSDRPSVGIGLDSCVIPTRHEGISLVETTDFFYPLINDPYMMVS